MRIAVLVFGRLNRCAEHYENIMESLGDNDIDFFVSSDNAPENILEDFIYFYNPKLYNNKPISYNYDLSKYPGRRYETRIDIMTRHFINKNRVLGLLEEYIDKTKVKYDCVLSLRVDCVFKDYFFFDSIQENTVYIPYGFDWVENGINDQLAYGKIDVMRKYNSINPLELLEKGLSIPHPESLNCANINFHKLLVERPDIDYYLER
jgi:hypothetical protein